MTDPFPQFPAAAPQALTPVAPPDFVRLSESLPPAIDRELGYVGEERFVLFYFEPRGDEVVWDDGRTYGFGAGGWSAFEDRVAPLAHFHGRNLGSSEEAGGDALVIDRVTGSAYFARRDDARRFLTLLTGDHG